MFTLLAVTAQAGPPDCSRNDFRGISDYVEFHDCRPYLHYFAVPHEDNEVVFPAFIEESKCGANCHLPFKTCIPTATANYTQTVYRQFTNGTRFCDVLELTQEIECTCGCKLTTCRDHEVFSQDKCRCECDLQEECPLGKTFNPDTCNCDCTHQAICTQGKMFDHDLCVCVSPFTDHL